jgi:nitrogenase iron protein NifH
MANTLSLHDALPISLDLDQLTLAEPLPNGATRIRVAIADVDGDSLGDVVCGGFAMPMREGYAEEVYLVTSGELMSLYAANNICRAIQRLATRIRSRCRLAGVICNGKNVTREEDLDSAFADRINSRLIQFVPRDRVVQLAELNKQTVIEYAPASVQAGVYRSLASKVMENQDLRIPTPLDIDDLESLALEFL